MRPNDPLGRTWPRRAVTERCRHKLTQFHNNYALNARSTVS